LSVLAGGASGRTTVATVNSVIERLKLLGNDQYAYLLIQERVMKRPLGPEGYSGNAATPRARQR
jgi:hypothetical protein